MFHVSCFMFHVSCFMFHGSLMTAFLRGPCMRGIGPDLEVCGSGAAEAGKGSLKFFRKFPEKGESRSGLFWGGALLLPVVRLQAGLGSVIVCGYRSGRNGVWGGAVSFRNAHFSGKGVFLQWLYGVALGDGQTAYTAYFASGAAGAAVGGWVARGCATVAGGSGRCSGCAGAFVGAHCPCAEFAGDI